MVFHTSHKTTVFENFFKKLDDKLRSISSLSEKENIAQYQDQVIKLLHERKASTLTDDELVFLQHKIEDLTMKFDETSIYHTIPNLILKDKPTAKESLKNCLESFSFDLGTPVSL